MRRARAVVRGLGQARVGAWRDDELLGPQSQELVAEEPATAGHQEAIGVNKDCSLDGGRQVVEQGELLHAPSPRVVRAGDGGGDARPLHRALLDARAAAYDAVQRRRSRGVGVADEVHVADGGVVVDELEGVASHRPTALAEQVHQHRGQPGAGRSRRRRASPEGHCKPLDSHRAGGPRRRLLSQVRKPRVRVGGGVREERFGQSLLEVVAQHRRVHRAHAGQAVPNVADQLVAPLKARRPLGAVVARRGQLGPRAGRLAGGGAVEELDTIAPARLQPRRAERLGVRAELARRAERRELAQQLVDAAKAGEVPTATAGDTGEAFAGAHRPEGIERARGQWHALLRKRCRRRSPAPRLRTSSSPSRRAVVQPPSSALRPQPPGQVEPRPIPPAIPRFAVHAVLELHDRDVEEARVRPRLLVPTRVGPLREGRARRREARQRGRGDLVHVGYEGEIVGRGDALEQFEQCKPLHRLEAPSAVHSPHPRHILAAGRHAVCARHDLDGGLRGQRGWKTSGRDCDRELGLLRDRRLEAYVGFCDQKAGNDTIERAHVEFEHVELKTEQNAVPHASTRPCRSSDCRLVCERAARLRAGRKFEHRIECGAVGRRRRHT